MLALAITRKASTSKAVIYWPQPHKLRGGIVCLHGSEGGFSGWNHVHAQFFAAHGFAAMAANYSPEIGLYGQPDIKDTPLEKIEEALSVMRDAMQSHGLKTALFGVSRGAEAALLVAEMLAKENSSATPDALALHAPIDTVWPAFLAIYFSDQRPEGAYPSYAAWLWRGSDEQVKIGSGIHLQAFRGPVFIAHGEDDDVWPVAGAKRLVDRLQKDGLQPEAHFYAGENHIFSSEAHNDEMEKLIAFLNTHLAPKAV